MATSSNPPRIPRRDSAVSDDHDCGRPALLYFADSYDEFVDMRVSQILDWFPVGFTRPENTETRLPSAGLFERVDDICCEQCWEHYRSAPCNRCGQPDSGVVPYSKTVATPDGPVTIPMKSVLCENCFETVQEKLRDGELAVKE